MLSSDSYVSGDNICLSPFDLKKIFKKTGVILEEASFIGSGSYCDVYDIGDEEVLRVSTEYSDRSLEKYLKGNPTYGFPEVYESFDLFDCNITICEKLYPIRVEGVNWERFISYIGIYDILSMFFETEQWSKKTRKVFQKEIEHLDRIAQVHFEKGIRMDDLHDENWLMRKNGEIVICDLGSVRFVEKYKGVE